MRVMAALLATAGWLSFSVPALAQVTLPVPCAGAGTCGTSGVPNLPFVTSGAASATTNGNVLTVQQASQRAILNWESFNVGAGGRVEFNQAFGAAATALNRIHQADPSVIAGTIRADGQVYLINANGVIFANGAQVNASTLIASSLDVSDELFNAGALFSQTTLTPAFQGTSGFVTVDDGAVLTASEGGKVMLFAPTVTNNGRIEAPGGQIVLAAAQKVYLRGSSDTNLRGLLVEIDGGGEATNDIRYTTDANGNTTIASQGRLIAERGNVMLTGLIVNQRGRISATTTVQENGSVMLLAQDTVSQATDLSTRNISRSGTVEIARDSDITISPDLSSTARIDANVEFQRSLVQVVGKQIHVAGSITAPSGEVSLSALLNPSVQSPGAVRNDSQVYLDETARIDVAGLRDVVLAMETNSLAVELRGDELKDLPLQRDGFLRGKTVYIDINEGTPLADVSKQIAAIPRGIAEKSTPGGIVTIRSEGDVIARAGSSIDVSGGSIRFTDGYVYTTQLVTGGRIVDIGSASPDVIYDGIANALTVADSRWGTTRAFSGQGRFVPGFVKGADAGAISITANAMALEGEAVATTVIGPYQRTAGAIPEAGRLSLLDFERQGDRNGAIRIHDVTIGGSAATPWEGSFGTPLPDDRGTDLNLGDWVSKGFGHFEIDRNGTITVGESLSLPTLGSLSLTARSLDLAADVRVPAGSIDLTTKSVAGEPLAPLTIRPGVTLSARGEWVNDYLPGAGLSQTAVPDAGSISVVSASDLLIGAALDDNGDVVLGAPATRVLLDVTGGARIGADGQVAGGDAGSITLASASEFRFVPGMALAGYSMTRGGSLTLNASGILVRDGALAGNTGRLAWTDADALASGRTLVVPSAAFNQLGFRSVTLGASLDDLVVQDGTTVQAFAPFLRPVASVLVAPTGSDILAVTTLAQTGFDQGNTPLLREPSQVSFLQTASLDTSRRLRVGTNAVIETDPLGSITLASRTLLDVDGTLSAPAGDIALRMDAALNLAYFDSQAIWLGSNARLLASGAATPLPSVGGVARNDVLAGGTITLRADRGYVIAEPGSVLDVSGAAASTLVLDVRGGGYRSQQVGADAGTILVSAAEGVFLEGDLLAGAPAVAGASGGTLAVSLTTANRQDADPNYFFPSAQRRLVVEPELASSVVFTSTSGEDGDRLLSPGDAIRRAAANDLDGIGRVPLDKVAAGGFASLHLVSDNVIQLQAPGSAPDAPGNLTLAVPHALSLHAPRLDVTDTIAQLDANYVAIGGIDNFSAAQGTQDTGGGSTGTGALTLTANLLDVIGNVGLYGAREVTFESTGDIRFSGIRNDANDVAGSIVAAQSLTFRAQQIYPTTFSTFSVTTSTASSIVVEPAASASAGTVPAVPLSAGGSLTLSGGGIRVAGTDGTGPGGIVRAPLGQVTLDATGAGGDCTAGSPGGCVVLEAGALVTTSAEGTLIPFGRIQNGQDWVYGVTTRALSVIDAPVASRVVLEGDQIVVRTSGAATIDVSGGGDLFGYEFVPGPQGSIDRLSLQNAGSSFAIVPGLGAAWAPYDTDVYGAAMPTFGAALSIDQVPALGLAGGTYAVLPARYALLPGAFLVTPMTGSSSMVLTQAVALTDGSYAVAGRNTTTGTAFGDSLAGGFRILPASLVRTLAEYKDYSGATFFRDAALAAGETVPRLPTDAGILAVVAQSDLLLDQGALFASRAPGARGAAVDFASERLLVAGEGAAAPRPGEVVISVESLNALGAESVFLGGLRTSGTDGVHLSLVAGSVRVDNAQGVALVAPEMLLGARDTVEVGASSRIQARGEASTGAGDVYRLGSVADSVTGDGGVLRLSAGGAVPILRENQARASGDVIVGSGAILDGRSIDVDATRENVLGGELVSAAGGTVSLGAGRISLGDAPAGTSGLVVGQTVLGQLGAVDTLVLRSYTTVDLYGDVGLGTDATPLGSLVIDSGGVVGVNAGTASIRADSLRLANSNGIAVPGSTAPTPGSVLDVHASSVVVGAGSKAIRGFADVRLSADGDLRLEGSGALESSAATTVSARRLVVGTGASQVLAAQDSAGAIPVFHDLTVARAAVPPATLSGGDLGGHLTLRGASVLATGVIEAAAGAVTLEAVGPGGDVTLAPGAVIDVAGVAKAFDDTTASAAAGTVTLRAAQGNVVVQGAGGDLAAALIDLSAAEGGDAGTLRVVAVAGSATIDGDLLASHGAGAGGSFELDARRIGAGGDGFDALTRSLNASGFSAARAVHLREGDISVGGEAIEARSVALTADTGRIVVAGTVGITAPTGGELSLFARDDVELGDGGRLLAVGTAGAGGRVQIGTSQGEIRLGAGSSIDVSGTQQDGAVSFRLPATTTSTSIAFTREDGATVSGVENFTVEGFLSFQASTLDTAFLNTVQSQFNALAANAQVIGTGLGAGGRFVPGIEIDSAGDMTLATAWNLLGWKVPVTGTAGRLTLRAGGDLTLSGTVSDGFSTALASTGVLQAGDSWSYRFVAGADQTSASPLAVLPGGAGDFALAAGQLIRTGTGSIFIAAAGDLDIGKAASGPNQSSAAIYTAGAPGAALSGFSAPAGANYPTGGGDISLSAGGDIRGAVTHQIASEWLQRQGQMTTTGTLLSGRNPTWWIDFRRFQQNVGALGGGNVSVRAEGGIENLSAVVPTTGRVAGAQGTTPTADDLLVTGGGDLLVSAGGDIGSGFYYVALGTGVIRAGGAVTAGSRTVASTNPASFFRDRPVATILALGDSTLTVSATGNVDVGAVINPTVVAQDSVVVPNARLTNPRTYFFTYSPDSAVRVASAAGDIRLVTDVTTVQAAVAPVAPRSGITFRTGTTSDIEALYVYPATLEAVALSGSVSVENPITLYPSSQGGLQLLADHRVSVRNDTVLGRAYVNLSDADPSRLLNPLFVPATGTTPANRQVVYRDVRTTLDPQPQNSDERFHAVEPLYALDGADNRPVRVVALEGDISGGFILAKQSRFLAGGDIVDLDLVGQQVNADDLTKVVAGGSIEYSTIRNATTGEQQSNLAGISVGGPGRIALQAGENIDLGNSKGVLSRGNLGNPALPAQGADISMTAGLVGDGGLAAFIDRYAAPGADGTAAESRIIAYVSDAMTALEGIPRSERPDEFRLAVARYEELKASKVPGEPVVDSLARAFEIFELLPLPTNSLNANAAVAPVAAERKAIEETYFAQVNLLRRTAAATGITPESMDSAFATLKGLSADEQRPLAERLLFNELKLSGRGFSEDGYSAYSRGFTASEAWFGPQGTRGGDLSLLFSQIKTESGGNISLLVPGGAVNAGQTTPPADSGSTKAADELGIIVQEAGGVRAFVRGRSADGDVPAVRGNFAVNESRVFTLRGGDILIWSTDGDIDAGRGAKTAVSAPPPILITDANGVTTFKFRSASGSGIRSILTDPDVPPGDVDLIAPAGEVNAGDAGIGAAGNLTIAAVRVVGADNIQVGGRSAGVPVDVSGSLSSTLSGVAGAAADATKSTERATEAVASAAQNSLSESRLLPSFLTVEVIGFGQ